MLHQKHYYVGKCKPLSSLGTMYQKGKKNQKETVYNRNFNLLYPPQTSITEPGCNQFQNSTVKLNSKSVSEKFYVVNGGKPTMLSISKTCIENNDMFEKYPERLKILHRIVRNLTLSLSRKIPYFID